MKVYGITNCNTVRKATDWLKSKKINFEFHDYKKQGITKEMLEEWTSQLGWEKMINKKGTTWRALSPEQQEEITDQATAVELMLDKPSIIKRPLIEHGKKLYIGFDEEQYAEKFKKK